MTTRKINDSYSPEPKRIKLEETPPINCLPVEMYCDIFLSIPLEDTRNAALTCKFWRELISTYKITGKKCEQLLFSITQAKSAQPDQIKILKCIESYVTHLDLSSFTMKSAQHCLVDFVSRYFNHITSISLPKYNTKQINKIYFKKTRIISYAQLCRIQNIASLTVLMLENCQISLDAFKVLGKMPDLKLLSLYNSNVTTEQLCSLQCSKSLETLIMGHHTFSVGDFQCLQNIGGLKDLRIFSSLFQQDVLQSFTNLSQLTHITLHENHARMPFFEKRDFLTHFQKLERFESTRYFYPISKTIKNAFLDLPDLTYLELDKTQLTLREKQTLQKKYKKKHSHSLKIKRYG